MQTLEELTDKKLKAVAKKFDKTEAEARPVIENCWEMMQEEAKASKAALEAFGSKDYSEAEVAQTLAAVRRKNIVAKLAALLNKLPTPQERELADLEAQEDAHIQHRTERQEALAAAIAKVRELSPDNPQFMAHRAHRDDLDKEVTELRQSGGSSFEPGLKNARERSARAGKVKTFGTEMPLDDFEGLMQNPCAGAGALDLRLAAALLLYWEKLQPVWADVIAQGIFTGWSEPTVAVGYRPRQDDTGAELEPAFSIVAFTTDCGEDLTRFNPKTGLDYETRRDDVMIVQLTADDRPWAAPTPERRTELVNLQTKQREERKQSG